jgi:hypothetical protein
VPNQGKIQIKEIAVPFFVNNTPMCQISCHTLPECSLGISGVADPNYFFYTHKKPIPLTLISQVLLPLVASTDLGLFLAFFERQGTHFGDGHTAHHGLNNLPTFKGWLGDGN